MGKGTVRVEIYTNLHRISGHTQPGPTGLFSFFNRLTESTVEIEDARIAALHQTAEQAESTARLWMVKAEIAAVAAGSRGDIGPIGTVRGGYTKPFPHRVRIVVGGYELRGLVETPGKLDFGALVLEGDSLFMPIYDARLNAILFPRTKIESPAILFNRKMVVSLTLVQKLEE
ncbi:MAG: hypothetical protein AB1449_08030 [Chloroflexota bacterium]